MIKIPETLTIDTKFIYPITIPVTGHRNISRKTKRFDPVHIIRSPRITGIMVKIPISIPTIHTKFIFSISTNTVVVLILMNLLMLFMGTFLDVAPIIIILIPIIWPIVMKLGVDPIHFGLITIVNMAIGQCTPPVGIALFVATGISKIPLGEMLGTYVKFIGAMIAVLLLITVFPDLVTFLPRLVMGTK